MEDNYTHIDDLLDDFSRGKLKPEELAEKIRELDIPDLITLAGTHTAAVNIIQRHNVLQQVQQVHQQFLSEDSYKKQDSHKSTVVNMRFLLKIAAVFVVAVFSAYILLITTTSSQELYKEFSQEYHVQTNRATDAEHVAKIVLAFNNKEFAAVITAFKELLHPTPREFFLAGYAYLQTGNYTVASQTFQKILNNNTANNERLYHDEAEYYLMLSLIQNKQYKEAYQQARKIQQDKYHTYHEKINNWLLVRLRLLS